MNSSTHLIQEIEDARKQHRRRFRDLEKKSTEYIVGQNSQKKRSTLTFHSVIR